MLFYYLIVWEWDESIKLTEEYNNHQVILAKELKYLNAVIIA